MDNLSFEEQLDSIFESKWLQKASKDMKRKGTEGEFSGKAKRAGMSTSAYANKILKDKGASTKLKRQASFAKNAIKISKK